MKKLHFVLPAQLCAGLLVLTACSPEDGASGVRPEAQPKQARPDAVRRPVWDPAAVVLEEDLKNARPSRRDEKKTAEGTSESSESKARQ